MPRKKSRSSTRPAPSSKAAGTTNAGKSISSGSDPQSFLNTVGAGRLVVNRKAKAVIFRQGEPADAVYYLQKGRIQLSVVSRHGKVAVIAQLDPGAFFGERCLAGLPVYASTASALMPSMVLKIDKQAMIRALHEQPALSEMFTAFMLTRSIRVEADLVDQLFNSSEQRLARLLLLLANVGKEGKLETVIPKVSQDLLAARVGTTRSRINQFMNKFRKLGLIEYNGNLKVHSSLLQVIVNGVD
ncbi:MAG TPA: Crp/Fnr family transcriptional regulator [Vineibacter sp.]|nr:Crp/Fnr family transcriptional regulator [Vineibacter sp.]